MRGDVRLLELTFILCVIIGVLFLSLFIFTFLKMKRARLITGALMSVISLATMAIFIYTQKSNGNPDVGKEFVQFYFPILVFICFAAIGVLSTIKLIKPCNL